MRTRKKKYRRPLKKDEAKKMYPDGGPTSTWQVLIARPRTSQWSQGISLQMVVDSGCNRSTIPTSMIPEEFLRDLNVIGEETAIYANGAKEPNPVVLVDLRLDTISGGTIILQDVPVNLSETADEALLGSDIMALLDHRNIGGTIIFLRPSDEFYELDDVEYDVQELFVACRRMTNVDPTTNVAKPPKSPSSPAEVTPLKNSFNKPSAPQPPKRSRRLKLK